MAKSRAYLAQVILDKKTHESLSAKAKLEFTKVSDVLRKLINQYLNGK